MEGEGEGFGDAGYGVDFGREERGGRRKEIHNKGIKE